MRTSQIIERPAFIVRRVFTGLRILIEKECFLWLGQRRSCLSLCFHSLSVVCTVTLLGFSETWQSVQ